MKRLARQVTAWLASATLLVTLVPLATTGAQAATASTASPAVSIQGGDSHFRTDGLIVKLRPDLDPYELMNNYDLQLENHLFDNWYTFRTQPDAAQDMYDTLRGDSDMVAAVELDYEISRPNYTIDLQAELDFCEYTACPDPLREIVKVPEAWESTKGTPESLIAMIGSGVDLSHPMLEGRLVQGFDFADGDGEPQDTHGIGTWEASVAAGSMVANVSGVDLEARVLPVRVLNDEGVGYMSTLIEGVKYAYDKGVKVAHVSVYSDRASLAFQELIWWCGNDREWLIFLINELCRQIDCFPQECVGWECNPPGCINCLPQYDRVIQIGGLTQDLQLSEFTPINPQAQLGIVTEGLFTADLDGRLALVRSASMSSAIAAGAASLVWSLDPGMSGSEVMERLTSTAEVIDGTGEAFQNGMMYLPGAVQW